MASATTANHRRSWSHRTCARSTRRRATSPTPAEARCSHCWSCPWSAPRSQPAGPARMARADPEVRFIDVRLDALPQGRDVGRFPPGQGRVRLQALVAQAVEGDDIADVVGVVDLPGAAAATTAATATAATATAGGGLGVAGLAGTGDR